MVLTPKQESMTGVARTNYWLVTILELTKSIEFRLILKTGSKSALQVLNTGESGNCKKTVSNKCHNSRR